MNKKLEIYETCEPPHTIEPFDTYHTCETLECYQSIESWGLHLNIFFKSSRLQEDNEEKNKKVKYNYKS